MKTVLSFNYLQAERDANRRLRDMRLEYPMDLFIEQVKLIEDRKAIISFTMKSATNPEVASFSVTGELRVEGTPEEISSALTQVDENPPAIWKDIYRDCVKVMVSLARRISHLERLEQRRPCYCVRLACLTGPPKQDRVPSLFA